MRRIYLNDEWVFFPFWKDTCISTSAVAEGEKIRLPHMPALLSYNYPNLQNYEKVCGYVRMLTVPEDFSEKEIWLTFEGVGHTSQVYINGQSAARHFCGYTAFSVNITPYIHFGCENRICVKVDSRENPQIPPFGSGTDFLAFGGIYRDVYIEIKDPAHIEDVFIRTKNRPGNGETVSGFPYNTKDMPCSLLAGPAQMTISVRLSEKALNTLVKTGNNRDDFRNGYIQICIFDGDDNCLVIKKQHLSHCFRDVHGSFHSTRSRTATMHISFKNISYWDVEQPSLYYAEVLLCRENGDIADSTRVRFGFRDLSFKEDGFYLNGRKLKITGLCRHQAYPYVGYAAPASLQKLDASILKNELCVNGVRTAHYPQSRYFIDRCDELGLLVFTEIPQIKTPVDLRKKKIALNNMREMVAQYRNHPSVILWGDGDTALFEKDSDSLTNSQAARRMDPTRLTNELRRLKNSVFLEDIYTEQNFGLSKMYDHEVMRVNHALSHGQLMEASFADPSIAGSFGRYMCDYQTYSSYGCGDGIAHEGVMDMFRNPKLAGSLYASQQDGCVCEIAPMTIAGDSGSGESESVWIFTNCDFVRVFREGFYVGKFFPERQRFGHLPHPPIRILRTALFEQGCFMKNGSNIFRFEFIKDGRLVRTIIRRPAEGVHLDVWCSHTCLIEENSYDMALLRIRAVDEEGLLLTHYNEPVHLRAWGPVAVEGPDTISLKGGCGGALIRTLGGSGNAKVTLFAHGIEPVEIYLDVKNRSSIV